MVVPLQDPLSGSALQAFGALIECRRLLLAHMGSDVLSRLEDPKIDAAIDGQVITL
ncbi:MAG: hypothetical protein VX338_01595 [Acidobacteriota bacterium]|nr:hypothetical protein [Acidobacteriota bacterium]